MTFWKRRAMFYNILITEFYCQMNYEAAVELLTKRYGKKEAIQRAHINELLNVQPSITFQALTGCDTTSAFIEKG